MATASIINSDMKELGDATKKLVNHVMELGVSDENVTDILQSLAFFAAIYVLILNRASWQTNGLTIPLLEYMFLTFPNWLFGILRVDIGRWITLAGVILNLFFYYHLPDYMLLPGSLIMLVVAAPSSAANFFRSGWIFVILSLGVGGNLLLQHIRASGGFRGAFTKIFAIPTTIGILLMFVFPVWPLIGLI